jgi:hypothetical protein
MKNKNLIYIGIAIVVAYFVYRWWQGRNKTNGNGAINGGGTVNGNIEEVDVDAEPSTNTDTRIAGTSIISRLGGSGDCLGCNRNGVITQTTKGYCDNFEGYPVRIPCKKTASALF